MLNFDYYFRKKITEEILEEFQDVIDAAVRRRLNSIGSELWGLVSGSTPTAVYGGSGFTLSINSGSSKNWSGFDRDGFPIDLGVNPYVTDALEDLFSLPVTNNKWVTFFVAYARDPQQPEVDPFGTTVYFRQEDSFTIECEEGVEDPSPTKPAIVADESRIYLCDVLLVPGMTDFSGAAIQVNDDRKRICPLAKAVEDGLDGTSVQLAILNANKGINGFFAGGALGFAQGYWDYRGKVDFGTGVITTFDDSASGLSWTPGTSAYSGDMLTAISAVVFYPIFENQAGVDGHTSDTTVMVIGAEGTTTSGTYPAGGPTGPFWTGVPLGGGATLIYEGGFLNSTDLTGSAYWTGRVGFLAIGPKAIP